MREKKIVIIVTVIIFTLLAIYGIFKSRERNAALADSVLAEAKITNMYNARGPETIEVEFYFGHRIVHSSFATSHWDSLSVNQKIRILVSKKYPDKYVKYVGIVK